MKLFPERDLMARPSSPFFSRGSVLDLRGCGPQLNVLRQSSHIAIACSLQRLVDCLLREAVPVRHGLLSVKKCVQGEPPRRNVRVACRTDTRGDLPPRCQMMPVRLTLRGGHALSRKKKQSRDQDPKTHLISLGPSCFRGKRGRRADIGSCGLHATGQTR